MSIHVGADLENTNMVFSSQADNGDNPYIDLSNGKIIYNAQTNVGPSSPDIDLTNEVVNCTVSIESAYPSTSGTNIGSKVKILNIMDETTDLVDSNFFAQNIPKSALDTDTFRSFLLMYHIVNPVQGFKPHTVQSYISDVLEYVELDEVTSNGRITVQGKTYMPKTYIDGGGINNPKTGIFDWIRNPDTGELTLSSANKVEALTELYLKDNSTNVDMTKLFFTSNSNGEKKDQLLFTPGASSSSDNLVMRFCLPVSILKTAYTANDATGKYYISYDTVSETGC